MIVNKLATRHDFSVSLGLLLGLLVITGLVLTTAMPVLGADGLSCTAPPLGMFGWWPAEGNANDITPHDHDGTFNGTFTSPSTAPTSGEVGRAFIFDGTDDYVDVPNKADLNPMKIT